MAFRSACALTLSSAERITSTRDTARQRILSFPLTMRETSSRSSMSCTCNRVPRSMASPVRLTWSASTAPPDRRWAWISMVDSGVRSSWDSVARN